VVVLRDGRSRTLSVTLGRRETAEGEAVPAAAGPAAPPAEQSMLGLTVRALRPEERDSLALPPGTTGLVVTAVDESSEAFSKGLRAGDVITEAGQQRIATPADLAARITEAREAGRKSILLLIRRGADPRFVALSID
jgi:serine protease Do